MQTLLRTCAVAFLLVLSSLASLAQNVIYLDRTSYTVNENAGTANIIVRLSRVDSNTVTVAYNTTDGTATAGSDYTATNGNLTFGPNDSAKLVQIPIIDDLTAEPTEQFSFTISNSGGGVIDATRSTATVTIQDNDGNGSTIGFDSAAYTVDENAGCLTITVRRSGGDLSQRQTVNYTTAPGSATEDPNLISSPCPSAGATPTPQMGSDYRRAAGTLTFDPNVTSQSFDVGIYDDSRVEGNETFMVNLSAPGQNFSFGQASATVTIVDNETSSVSFSTSLYSVAENGGNATVTLLRTGNTNTAGRVIVNTSGGTATADQDYASITNLVVDFAQGQTFATVNIPIFDDQVVEGTESFYVTLSSSPNSGIVIPGGTQTAEVQIIDDEAANTVEFASADYSVNENDPAGVAQITVRVNRQANSQQTISVQYFTETGSATPGADYTPITASSNSVLVFGPTETIKTFAIPIVNDNTPENTETVRLVLANPTNAALGANSTATLSILDDDSAGVVQFSSANYSVVENSGSVTLSVLLNRTGNTNSAVSVNYATVAGSAASTRFVPTSGTINFPPGSAIATITIPVVDDAVIEPPQNFFVVLSDPLNASLGSPSSASVAIQDDDGLNSISFDAADYGVVETEGVVQVRLRARRGGDPNEVLTVDIALGATGDTAILGTDYGQPSSTTVTFPPGVSVQSVAIPITNNPAPQGVKLFTARLTNPGAFSSLGQQSSARVTIFDNAGSNTVQLLTSAQRFREGDQAVMAVTVVRFGNFAANGTTVNYTTELRPGDTAQPGVNFTPTSGSIFFARIVNGNGATIGNETLHTILIPIPDNSLIQGDVTFHVTLTSSDVAQFGSISTTQITIEDDDLGNVVEFNSPTYSVLESAGNAVLTVKLTPNGDPSRASSVDYAATPITAYAGFDFSPVSGTLTFAPGETSKTILVPIFNDDIPEAAETFRVTLTSRTPGVLIGNNGSAIVTIVDDDAVNARPTFQFNTSALSVTNSAGVANVTVTLARDTNQNGTFSVHFATDDISALAGRDYVATSGTLVFGPGETSKTIPVPLIIQIAGAPTREFRITLSNPSTGSLLGDITEVIVSITNPDLSTKVMSLSTRGPVQQGDSVMIAGVIVRGSALKPVIVRAIGPSMTQYGVADAVADPTLALYDSNGQQIAYNDDYGNDSTADLATIAANNLTPASPREAAIVATLAAGNYTAILRGKSNGTGLIEAYDTAPTAASSLGAISTRGKVETGDSVMIAGFIISPPTGQTGTGVRVAIRAIGPSLSQYGVAGVLADPTLELYRGADRILTNDNWTTNSTADQQELQANGLAPGNAKEAALITTLDPGSYTAIVRGKNNATGVALAEVYRIGQ